ncbi:uncharacterized protein [Oryctolagus cuniculus]|uniref:uncharacterized protein n=1 Tax=Oryctolagus cuniculus TaxID=9986 RepID=UPI003879F8CA
MATGLREPPSRLPPPWSPPGSSLVPPGPSVPRTPDWVYQEAWELGTGPAPLEGQHLPPCCLLAAEVRFPRLPSPWSFPLSQAQKRSASAGTVPEVSGQARGGRCWRWEAAGGGTLQVPAGCPGGPAGSSAPAWRVVLGGASGLLCPSLAGCPGGASGLLCPSLASSRKQSWPWRLHCRKGPSRVTSPRSRLQGQRGSCQGALSSWRGHRPYRHQGAGWASWGADLWPYRRIKATAKPRPNPPHARVTPQPQQDPVPRALLPGWAPQELGGWLTPVLGDGGAVPKAVTAFTHRRGQATRSPPPATTTLNQDAQGAPRAAGPSSERQEPCPELLIRAPQIGDRNPECSPPERRPLGSAGGLP